MGLRLELSKELRALLGSKHVYFQPPASVKIVHPCFIYELADIYSRYADDLNYNMVRQYTLTYVDLNPDSTMPERVLTHFRYCAFSRHFSQDNIHHSVFSLYY